MKLILSILFCSFFFLTPTLPELREQFQKSANNKEITQQFYRSLEDYSGNNSTILAYKGASSIMYSRYFGNKEKKTELLKNGAKLIDNAVNKEPKNAEIRLIRFVIQENLPKFMKYNTHIAEDRKTLISLYPSQNAEVRKMIKHYSKVSKSMTNADKEKLN